VFWLWFEFKLGELQRFEAALLLVDAGLAHKRPIQ
jgi:hypothetical protein